MTVNARMPESLASATGTITVDLGPHRGELEGSGGKGRASTLRRRRQGRRLWPRRRTGHCCAGARGLHRLLHRDTRRSTRLRAKIAPNADIYALDGLVGNTAAAFAHLAVKPVLSTLDDIVAWSALCRARGEKLPAAIHIDTGLHRLGLPVRDVRRLAADPSMMAGIELDLVMSHLASADNPRDPKNRDQLVAFETLSALFPGVLRSLAASDGLMLGPAYPFRSRQARIRDLWRSSFANRTGARESCRNRCSANSRGRRCRAGRNSRLFGDVARQTPEPDRDDRSRLCRRRPAQRQRARRPSGRPRPDQRPSCANGRAHLDGSHHRRRHRSSGRRGDARRICETHRRGPDDRRRGICRRDHRLRNPDPPRPRFTRLYLDDEAR